MKKQCSKCGEIKDISEYKPTAKHPKGSKGMCLNCQKTRKKELYNLNIEKNREIARLKYYKNKSTAIKYRIENKDKINSYQKNYYDKNKKKINERNNINYTKTKKSIKQKQGTNEYKEKRARRQRSRYQNDIDYKLLCNLRVRIRDTITREYKEEKTMELIGCSVGKLKAHLKSKFYLRNNGDKMTWENKGLFGWHIDHIRPCADFDLTDPEQQKECFHYTNLQPLWAEDNLSKSDKLDWVKEA